MSRVPVTYAASSGNVYNLQADGKRIRRADFHTWEFKATGQALRYGLDLRSFASDPATYDMTLVFTGALSERRELIRTLHEEWENDIRTVTPGRIYWGESGCYIECYVVKSDTHPESQSWYTANDITIYAPYPFWVNPIVCTSTDGSAAIFETQVELSEYHLTITALEDNCQPRYLIITGNCNIYGGSNYHDIVFDNIILQQGERVEVDSREKLCLLYDTSGKSRNILSHARIIKWHPPDTNVSSIFDCILKSERCIFHCSHVSGGVICRGVLTIDGKRIEPI